MSKAIKGIDTIKKLCNVFPRCSLITIHKSSVKSHLDYGGVF